MAICALLLRLAFFHSVPADRVTRDGAKSEDQKTGGYAGSESCKECHEDEYRLFQESHHRLAQRGAQPKLEAPAFIPDRSFDFSGSRVSVGKTDSGYFVTADGLDSTQKSFRVESVIGVSPLRQYLVGFPGGRLQTLESAYDPRANQWFDVFGAENRRPGEWGHWTGRGMNWNSMCAACHNTRVQKNYRQSTDDYRTEMAESGVGCEACHGPLRTHNEWQKQFGRSGQPDPTLPHWPKERVLDNCGFCHSRRAELTGEFKPGDTFLDHMRPTLVDASEIFYADGQVREEDYEYAPFIGSRMHLRGVQCSDCHDPHTARIKLPGNWLCMRCHDGSYTNAPIINPVGHSHHKVFGCGADGSMAGVDIGSYREEGIKETGGQCVNCHMPQTTYMQRHHRHDHGFTCPDPELTKIAGIPNACNRCHKDKDPDWSAKYCEEWYGSKMQRPSRTRSLLIYAARRNDSAALAGLVDMLTTNDVPYWRAVAAGLLAPWTSEPTVRIKLAQALDDPEPLVRLESASALDSCALEPQVAQALRRHLSDPIRAVRVAAAWACKSSVETSSVAGLDLSRYMDCNADQPSGQMQLGAFFFARGQPEAAVQHYQKAVAWDPNSAVSRHDYAIVLSSLGRAEEAIAELAAACRLEPTNAGFRFELGLGFNEAGQAGRAIECLRAAVKLDPSFAKAWYNLGLALSSEGKTEEALDALVRSEAADPRDPRPPYARASILARLGALEQARKAAAKALSIDPGFTPAAQLLESLR